MKKFLNPIITMFIAHFIFFSCEDVDYKNKEFYVQEVYIISSESTSAREREIDNIDAYTFVDTLMVLNESYDIEVIENLEPGEVEFSFKIGIGGSLMAAEDNVIKIGFDQENLDDYNIIRNSNYTIPSPDLYTTSAPFDQASQTFSITIKAGTASTALIFTMPILRDSIEEYANYAIPLKIIESEKFAVSRLYSKFLLANFIVNTEQIVNWSGFPIPKLPMGRYHSARLQGNPQENSSPDGYHRVHKFISKLGDTEELENHYTIWGTGVWSFEMFGLHPFGWMYNKLFLNDLVFGTYTMQPVLEGDLDYPFFTFRYSTVQGDSYDNKYDPRTQTLTLNYTNVIGNDYTDVLTYIPQAEDETDREYWYINTGQLSESPVNWYQVRAWGYKFWLPIDDW